MADLYCWYVMTPSGPPPRPRVTRDRLEALLQASDALSEAPCDAIAVVTRTPLNTFVDELSVAVTDVLGSTDCGPDSVR